jgi:hypothetical protein
MVHSPGEPGRNSAERLVRFARYRLARQTQRGHERA